MKNKFMQRAIELSIESINLGGGPLEVLLLRKIKLFLKDQMKLL